MPGIKLILEQTACMFVYPRLASLPPLATGFWEQMHNLDEIVDEHELVPEILIVRVIYPEEF